MSIYGGTLDAVTVDPATGRPAPGVAVYAFDAATAGTLLGSVLSDNGGGFVLDLPDVAQDRVWVSTSTTGERFPVYAQDALDRRALAADVAASLATKANASTVGALTTRVDTTETRVGTVENELGGRLSAPTLSSTFETGHNPKLRKWYGALANRYAVPARVLVIGDSNSEGTGATTYTRRWQQVLQSELRGRFQPAGVGGALLPYISASPRTNPLPTGGGVATSGNPGQASYGLGLRALQISTGQSVTFTFTGDRCKLLGTKGQAVGLYNIAVDGGAGSVVNGWQAGAAGLSSAILWDSGTLTRGTHTVVVTRDASSTGNVFPEGLLTFDGDHDSGVRVIDAARHGATVGLFNTTTGWMTAAQAVGPFGLCIMPWGANDATSGTTAAAFGSALTTLIANVRATGFAGSFLLVEMPKRGNATEQVWTDYRAQIEAVAAADADVAVLDLRRRMPDYGTAEANAQGLYYDEVHYLDKGQGWIADQIASAIIPR